MGEKTLTKNELMEMYEDMREAYEETEEELCFSKEVALACAELYREEFLKRLDIKIELERRITLLSYIVAGLGVITFGLWVSYFLSLM